MTSLLDSAAASASENDDTSPSFSWRERSRTRFGGLLDRLAVRAMSFAFDQTLMPSAGELAAVRSSAEPYLSSALADDPRRFFAESDDVGVPDRVRTGTHRKIPGGTIATHELASVYAPFHSLPDVERHESNDWIPVEHWVHDRPAPATAIALHGFTMGNPSVDAAVLMVADWFRLGLDVALVTLPFHGTRRPPNARYSGELFASWHVGRLNEAVRQSIHDVQRVAAWLQHERTHDVGVIGMSLGGYLAALLAGLRSDLRFVIPIAAPVRLGSFPSALFASSRYARSGAAPLSPEELDAAYRVHSPLTYPIAVPRERAMIIAGRGDHVVDPEQPLALWRHWRRPPIHWYDGSHVTPFRRPSIFAAGARHLRRTGAVPS